MTRMEELRIQKMLTLGCVCCAQLDIVAPAEVHHLLDGGRRLGDWFTIPLCASHHRGTPWSEAIPQEYRVAIASGRKLFVEVFPPERRLWEIVQERLGLSWPAPKIVPRRVA